MTAYQRINCNPPEGWDPRADDPIHYCSLFAFQFQMDRNFNFQHLDLGFVLVFDSKAAAKHGSGREEDSRIGSPRAID